MKITEKGILIHRFDYSETSLIVQLLTEIEGLKSFLFQGAKRKKGMVFSPLSLVEFTYYKRKDSDLGKLTELNLLETNHEIVFSPLKSSIAFFIAELIQKTCKPGHVDKAFFEFIWFEIIWIAHSEELGNYIFWFLGQFANFSGIQPIVESENPTIFDLKNGKLTSLRPTHLEYIEGSDIHWFENCILYPKEAFLALQIPQIEKRFCIEKWIKYFDFHFHGLRELKSLEIIRSIHD